MEPTHENAAAAHKQAVAAVEDLARKYIAAKDEAAQWKDAFQRENARHCREEGRWHWLEFVDGIGAGGVLMLITTLVVISIYH